jgi:hypothetical protein
MLNGNLPDLDKMIPSRSPSPVRVKKGALEVGENGEVNYDIKSDLSDGHVSEDVDIQDLM